MAGEIVVAAGWWAEVNRLLRDAGQPEACLGLATAAAWMSPVHAANWIMMLRRLGGDDFGAPEHG